MKKCSCCKLEKPFESFYKNKAKKDGFANQCKSCRKTNEAATKALWYLKNKEKELKRMREWKKENRVRWNEYCKNYRLSDNFTYQTPNCRFHRSKYRAAILMATPKWSDLKRIEAIYNLANTLSNEYKTCFEVDHIHPLQGKYSTGLHVWYNLQILPKSLNRSKGNKIHENIIFPRVSDNFDDYLSELKMYAELSLKQD